METKTRNLLPKILSGTIHEQFKKCGKSNCKCFRGELHGSYYYHFIRRNGKLHKRYLKSSEVAEVRRACTLRQIKEKADRRKSVSTWKLLRSLRENIREYQSLISNQF